MTAPGVPNARRFPRVTILTPSYNGARYIREAVESVRRQKYPDLEHIVFDAGSTDRTLEILRNYPTLCVVSECDEGAHDAMNKGIRRASGEIIGFLNTDDIYPEGVVSAVEQAFAADPALDVAVGRTVVFEETNRGTRRVVVARDHARENGFWLPELTFGAPGLNGRFFHRRVFERIGDFTNDYYISADRHFLMRVAMSGLKAKHIGRTSVLYRLHPGSATINAQGRQKEAMAREHVRMARELRSIAHDRVAREILAAWHTLESVKLVLTGFRALRTKQSLEELFGLCRRDPFWVLRIPRFVSLRNAVRRLDLGPKTAQGEALS
ncbi:MAG TPA: glycosyltransferase family 2 protein [Alphaproteobacteria bacterium]